MKNHYKMANVGDVNINALNTGNQIRIEANDLGSIMTIQDEPLAQKIEMQNVIAEMDTPSDDENEAHF